MAWYRSITRNLVACLAFVLAVSAMEAQAAAKKQKVSFPSLSGTPIAGVLIRPKSAKPLPAIIAMHGCGGLYKKKKKTLLPAREDWARRFERAGYAVLLPDSYTPRGVREICSFGPANAPVKMKHHVQDLIGAANWLTSQPFIDANRIAIIGWGLGGTAVLRVLDTKFWKFQQLGVKAAIAIYPACHWLTKIPDLDPNPRPVILMGAKDDWVPPASCKALSKKWGSPITLYPGAYHNFDAPNRPVRIRKTGSGRIHAGTNPAARTKAIKEVMAIFKTALASPQAPAPAKK